MRPASRIGASGIGERVLGTTLTAVTDTGPGPSPDNPPDTAPAGSAEAEAGARLEAERTHLGEQLHELGADEAEFSADEQFADGGQVAAEQGENRALAGELREQLDDVERAIGKLDDGSYGQCEVCGEPIGDARLEAMPAARFCIDHASS